MNIVKKAVPLNNDLIMFCYASISLFVERNHIIINTLTVSN